MLCRRLDLRLHENIAQSNACPAGGSDSAFFPLQAGHRRIGESAAIARTLQRDCPGDFVEGANIGHCQLQRSIHFAFNCQVPVVQLDTRKRQMRAHVVVFI